MEGAAEIAVAGVKNDAQKRALLLHLGGESLQKIFIGLTETGNKFDEALAVLNKHFEPKKNIRYKRTLLFQARNIETR